MLPKSLILTPDVFNAIAVTQEDYRLYGSRKALHFETAKLEQHSSRSKVRAAWLYSLSSDLEEPLRRDFNFDAKKLEDAASAFFQQAWTKLEPALSELKANVRGDLQRSRVGAGEILARAEKTARSIGEVSIEVAGEIRQELRQTASRLNGHLVSEEFEKQIDELVREAGRDPTEVSTELVHDERWFAHVHASLQEETWEIENDGFSPRLTDEELKARRERIGRKLAFLFARYRNDVLSAARTGAFVGSVLGRQGALRLAFVAGGAKLIFLLGGVTYTVFVRDRNDRSNAA